MQDARQASARNAICFPWSPVRVTLGRLHDRSYTFQVSIELLGTSL